MILQQVRIITSNEDLTEDEECCPSLLVTTGGGDDALSGLYQVKGKEESLPDARCVDGCVYGRPGSADDYCMVPDNGEGDSSVQCSTESGGDCCPLVSVGGDLPDVSGDYVLSQYSAEKP